MFRGANKVTVDSNGRLAIPTRYHERIDQRSDGQLVVTVDRQCLLISQLPDWEEIEAKPVNQWRLNLKYGPNGERIIRHVRRVSKPGRRVYAGTRSLRPVLNGLGISIISTSRGVISDREARQRNLGGEVLCELW